jgi:O-antigen/teichoic acid export membrane protein
MANIQAALVALRRHRLLKEGAWVTFGQVSSAVGALLGIRMLTELLAPATFGELALAIGIAALAYGLVGNPFMQALLRYYPDSTRTIGVESLRKSVTACSVKATAAFGVIWLAGWWLYSEATGASQWFGLLVVALLAVDLARSIEITLFNAARRQRPMALSMVADAWGRPITAVAGITLVGATVSAVVVSYVVATLVLLGVLYLVVEREGVNSTKFAVAPDTAHTGELLRYALPLVPLGLIGWISNLSDRYVLAGLSGLEQAGIYAAAFAVASRPAWLLGGAVETTLRPIYFHAVSSGDRRQQTEIFRIWLMLQVSVVAALTTVFWLFSDEVSDWLLGERFRSAAPLMPWIAGGCGIVVVAQAFAGLCYASRNTARVLKIELTGALARVAIGYPAIYVAGLPGAAIAVPISAVVQLTAAIVISRRFLPITAPKLRPSKQCADRRL